MKAKHWHGDLALTHANPWTSHHRTSILLLAMMLLAHGIPMVQAQTVVGDWPFSGNANDASGYGNDGTVTGATLTTDRHGNTDSAYHFDGIDDVINFGNDTSLQGADVTAMCWIKSERDDAQWAPTILVKSTKSVDGYAILDGGNNLFAEPNRPGSWQAFGVTTHTVGQWHHLAYVYDSTAQMARFYKDGSMVGELSFNMAAPTSSPLMVGYGYNTLNPNRVTGFQGSIDDVRVYNGALTTEQISAMLVPEIVIELPESSDLTSGVSTINFGTQAEGFTVPKTFTIRNTGDGLLTGLNGTIDGANASDFSLTASPNATLAAGQSTTFTVEFSPTAGGTRTASLHVASNDGDESPFDINLTAQGLMSDTDGDSDGMNDAAEFKLAALGFDWQIDNSALVDTLNTHANLHGLYSESQIGSIHPDAMLIGVTNGSVSLELRLQQSDDLSNWVDFGSAVQWSAAAGDKAFYRYFTTDPQSP